MWIKLQSTMLNTNNISFVGIQKSPKDASKWAVLAYSIDNVKFVLAEGDKEHCYDAFNKLSDVISEEEGVYSHDVH